MDKWFLIMILLLIYSSVSVTYIRRKSMEEKDRIKKGELTAEDFIILD